jgi:hypothetical protein
MRKLVFSFRAILRGGKVTTFHRWMEEPTVEPDSIVPVAYVGPQKGSGVKCVPKLVVSGPLGELDLGDEDRFALFQCPASVA